MNTKNNKEPITTTSSTSSVTASPTRTKMVCNNPKIARPGTTSNPLSSEVAKWKEAGWEVWPQRT